MQESSINKTIQISNSNNGITVDLPSIKNLSRVSEEDLPKQSGVYFIFNLNNELCYIGQSKNIKQRIRLHLNTNNILDIFRSYQVPYQEIGSFAFILVEDDYWRVATEQIYIASQRPKYNLSPANPTKSDISWMNVEDERFYREKSAKKTTSQNHTLCEVK